MGSLVTDFDSFMVMFLSGLLSLSFDSGFHVVSCYSKIPVPVLEQLGHFFSLSSRALMATTTVLVVTLGTQRGSFVHGHGVDGVDGHMGSNGLIQGCHN
jgi:hypothetical protein